MNKRSKLLCAGGVCTLVLLGIADIAAATDFPEGVVTTGIKITPDVGEGEGEGEGQGEVTTEAHCIRHLRK